MSKVLDYDALAKQHGAIVDYDALAKQHGGTSGEINPLLLESRKQASASDFERIHDNSTVSSRAREAAIGVLEPFALQNLVPGVINTLKTAGKVLVKGDARGALDLAKQVVTAPVEPIKDVIGGISEGDYDRAAYGAGGVLSKTVPAIEGVRSGVKPLARATVRAALPSAEELQTMANVNKARALSPTTLQGRADAAAIAEDFSKTGKALGLRGKTIDRNIMQEHEAAGQRVNQVETRLVQDARPEMQTAKRELLNEIDGAKAKLNLPRLKVTARPEAITQLNQIRDIIDQLPDFIDFDQLIELRRQLDARAQDAGAFGVNADSLKADLSRGAADMVRGKLNRLDPELKIANREYSMSRKAVDMVERRQLGEVGKVGTGLPGRGAILDDLLATWAGHAMGGPVVGGGAELINLARQSRGFANVKGSLQQKAANFMTKPQRSPAGLIGPGAPALPPVEGASSVTASRANAAPATREIRTGRLLGTGGPLSYDELISPGGRAPKIPTSGPAKGMTLSHIDMDPLTGAPKVWVYTESSTGRQLKFSTPQK